MDFTCQVGYYTKINRRRAQIVTARKHCHREDENPQVVHCAACDKEGERGVFLPTANLLAEELAQAHDVVNRRLGIAALPAAIADAGKSGVYPNGYMSCNSNSRLYAAMIGVGSVARCGAAIACAIDGHSR